MGLEGVGDFEKAVGGDEHAGLWCEMQNVVRLILEKDEIQRSILRTVRCNGASPQRVFKRVTRLCFKMRFFLKVGRIMRIMS